MKKIVLLLSALVLTIVLTGCGEKYTTYVDMTYKELEQKLENKETFAFVIGRDGCSGCESYKVTMDKLIKEKQIPIYYLKTNNLTEEEYNKLSSLFYFQYTPTTIFIKDGEEKTTYDRIIGSVDAKVVIKKLEKYNLLGDK